MANLQLFKPLVSSWRDSLRLFLPESFLQFTLIVLNSLKRLIFNILQNLKIFTLIVLLSLVSLISNAALYGSQHSIFSIPFVLAYAILLSLYAYILLIGLRPSVMLKDRQYFWIYSMRSSFYFLFILTALVVWHYSFSFAHTILFYSNLVNIIKIGLSFILFFPDCIFNFNGITIFFISPLLVIPYLFLIDAKPKYKEYIFALIRGLAMILFNYPYFLITYGVTKLVFYLLNTLSVFIQPLFIDIDSFSPISLYITIIVILPFYYSCLVNFYVKKMHEQFDLYYN